MSKLQFNKSGLALSRRMAAESSVLLKNEKGALPLKRNERIALFGRNQCDTYKGGGGAADLWAVECQPYCEGLEKLGRVYKPLLKKYRAFCKANYDPARNKFHNSFKLHASCLPEVPIDTEEVLKAAKNCDTAVVFIGRFAIEGEDIANTEGQYKVTAQEKNLFKKVTTQFKKTVLVLNIPCALDLEFLDDYKFDAIIHNFYPGQCAGNAIADLLYGRIAPCGRLPFSWAKNADCYNTNEGFGGDKIVYSEGLYMGYRYFDTFKKDVVFPFGFGLSYTDFCIESLGCSIDKTKVTINVKVTNVGKNKGREVVQCYLSAPDGSLDKPFQVLCAFAKTDWLKVGETQILTLCFDLLNFTSYSERCSSYLLEKGDYIVRVGKHSRETEVVCTVTVKQDFVYKKVLNRLNTNEKINEIKKVLDNKVLKNDIERLEADFNGIETSELKTRTSYNEFEKAGDYTFEDLLCNRCTPEELVACLSDEELALMLTGDGFEKQNALSLLQQPLVVGEGTHTHSVPRLKIPSSVMQDGPNGVRATSFVPPPLPPKNELSGRDCVCYPSAIAQAASWDKELVRKMAKEIAVDLDKIGYNGLCAPGVNLHRNVRCGRNFEYFSEDPVLAAEIAAAVIEGVQYTEDGKPTGHYAVLKHFACNNSEDMRLTSDSVISERTARELYLRVFEYVLDRVEPFSVMSAYNKLNGIYASANPDLLDGILRYEWHYKGWIMTDWDVYASDTDCILAGADTCMPGCFVSFDEFEKNGVCKATMQRRAANLIYHLARTSHYLNGKLCK